MCTKLTTVVSQKSPDFEKKSCFFADFPVTINFSFFKVSCYAGGILPPETPPKLNSASPRYVPKSFPHFGEQVPLVRLRFGDAGGIPPGAPLYTGLRPQTTRPSGSVRAINGLEIGDFSVFMVNSCCLAYFLIKLLMKYYFWKDS